MRKLLIGAVVASLGIAVYAGVALAGPPAGKGGPEPTGVAVAVPMPGPGAGGSLTLAQVTAAAEQTFPRIEPFGYYGVCGLTGDTADCPYTDRMKVRLADLRDTPLRAQNPSPTRAVVPELTGSGSGVAHVRLFGGRDGRDLLVVLQDGRVLVDDATCAGRPETSLYARFTAC